MIIPPSASPVWVKSELSKKQDKLTQGGGISISNNVVSVDLAEATQTSSGLMSADDKKNLEALKAGTIAEYVKDVTLDNYALKFTKSDGSTVQPTLTAVEVNPSTDNASYPVMLGTSTSKGFQSAKVVVGVTVNPSAKAITASKFYGALEGTASRATADGDGQNIASNYAKKGEIPDISGLATKAELGSYARTSDLDKYALDTDLSAYLPIGGGTMGGTLTFNGGDGVGASKISLPKGKGQITDESTATIFGFVNSTELTVGHSSYALKLRGSGSRPTFNGANLALASDVPDVSGFATKAEIPDVSGFATKSEVSLLPTFEPKVVSALPTSNISTKTLYLVPADNGENDRYNQYIYINNAWERIGSGMMTVDSSLSESSTNPVQNKVIKAALDGKLSTAGGTMAGHLDLNSGVNIRFGTTNYFQGHTASGNRFDIFGLVNSTRLVVGGTYPTLELRGKSGTKVTYNGENLALESDIPDVSGFATKGEIPDISGLATKTYVDDAIGNIDIGSLSGFLPLTGGTITGPVAIKQPHDLFGEVGILDLGRFGTITQMLTAMSFNISDGTTTYGAGFDNEGFKTHTGDGVTALKLGTTSTPWPEIHGAAIYQNGLNVPSVIASTTDIGEGAALTSGTLYLVYE